MLQHGGGRDTCCLGEPVQQSPVLQKPDGSGVVGGGRHYFAGDQPLPGGGGAEGHAPLFCVKGVAVFLEVPAG